MTPAYPLPQSFDTWVRLSAYEELLAWIIHERTVSVAPTAGNGL